MLLTVGTQSQCDYNQKTVINSRAYVSMMVLHVLNLANLFDWQSWDMPFYNEQDVISSHMLKKKVKSDS
jgi:hypothetical protein